MDETAREGGGVAQHPRQVDAVAQVLHLGGRPAVDRDPELPEPGVGQLLEDASLEVHAVGVEHRPADAALRAEAHHPRQVGVKERLALARQPEPVDRPQHRHDPREVVEGHVAVAGELLPRAGAAEEIAAVGHLHLHQAGQAEQAGIAPPELPGQLARPHPRSPEEVQHGAARSTLRTPSMTSRASSSVSRVENGMLRVRWLRNSACGNVSGR